MASSEPTHEHVSANGKNCSTPMCESPVTTGSSAQQEMRYPQPPLPIPPYTGSSGAWLVTGHLEKVPVHGQAFNLFVSFHRVYQFSWRSVEVCMKRRSKASVELIRLHVYKFLEKQVVPSCFVWGVPNDVPHDFNGVHLFALASLPALQAFFRDGPLDTSADPSLSEHLRSVLV